LDDTAILNSVWSAFVKVAAEFPEDGGVVVTLQHHGWYSRHCIVVAERIAAGAQIR
jgi:hypothetical protein